MTTDDLSNIREAVGEEAWAIFESWPGDSDPAQVALDEHALVKHQHQSVRPAMDLACPTCGKAAEVPCREASMTRGFRPSDALASLGPRWTAWTVCSTRMAVGLGRKDLVTLFDRPPGIICDSVHRLPDDLLNLKSWTQITLDSNLIVEEGSTVRVTGDADGKPFRPTQLFVYDDANWVIHDVSIARRSQFSVAKGIPDAAGTLVTMLVPISPLGVPATLLTSAVVPMLQLDDMDVGMHMEIVATRFGDPGAFRCDVHGHAGFDRRVARPRAPRS